MSSRVQNQSLNPPMNWSGSYISASGNSYKLDGKCFSKTRKIVAYALLAFSAIGFIIAVVAKNWKIVALGDGMFIAGVVSTVILLVRSFRKYAGLDEIKVEKGEIVDISQKNWKIKSTMTHEVIKINDYLPSDKDVAIQGLNDKGDAAFQAFLDFGSKKFNVIYGDKIPKQINLMIKFKKGREKLAIELTRNNFKAPIVFT